MQRSTAAHGVGVWNDQLREAKLDTEKARERSRIEEGAKIVARRLCLASTRAMRRVLWGLVTGSVAVLLAQWRRAVQEGKERALKQLAVMAVLRRGAHA